MWPTGTQWLNGQQNNADQQGSGWREISHQLEAIWGCYVAPQRAVSGAQPSENKNKQTNKIPNKNIGLTACEKKTNAVRHYGRQETRTDESEFVGR